MDRKLEQFSFLDGANAPYLAELYRQYRQAPDSVEEDWRAFFKSLGPEADAAFKNDTPPQWPSSRLHTNSAPSDVAQETLDSIRALMLIRAYRVRGHLEAKLDPLGIENRGPHPELNPTTYGFTEADWDREIFIHMVLGFEKATLRQIMAKLKETYCGTVGIEFMHMQDPEQKSWIQERIENADPAHRVTSEDRPEILRNLIHAEAFEKFLHVKYPGTKRFGLEGGESLIPALEAIAQNSAKAGVTSIVFGTSHRGRLSILANILHKPLRLIFSKFHGEEPDTVMGSGDVKYHLGFSGDRAFGNHKMHLSLISNPSHLEAVDPVVLGKVRAEQTRIGDIKRKKIMGILLHGDAAFAGQGLVAETLELSGLRGYHTGGTLHIIINNQIGFTTSPPHSRSSPYSSDIAKAIQVPIFHVNGDDPESVVWVARLAADYRYRFSQDVVVDLVCYRRHGHNEIDEPAFTQPKMYKAISQHPTTRTLYENQLTEKKILSTEDTQKFAKTFDEQLKNEFEISNGGTKNQSEFPGEWLTGVWTGIKAPDNKENAFYSPVQTAVSPEILKEIGKGISKIPKDFNLNSKIARQLEAKKKIIESGEDIDWATAEALAFGSLLLEGTPVRLSGQDCGRGTFSQRHAVWIDQENEQKHIPLNYLKPDQPLFEVVDSPLAEASILGFEYGYSISNPNALVMWEAQFGDFANGAQVIIDQFVSSGEAKWLRLSGLTMLLPHGYEGQGPEHSSCRLERFLQLCAESNLQVVNCSTPANYFHVLRRQVRGDTRKPLIVATPKSLLRHRLAVSSLKDMSTGSHFLPVINDHQVNPEKITRVVLCSGKIYYELFQEREQQNIKDIALIRLEQYYPFPANILADILKPYKHAEFVWCQEEPMNMGAWTFLDRRLEDVLVGIGVTKARPLYAGRPAAASPATGSLARHNTGQEMLIRLALTRDQTITRGVYAI